MVRPRQMARLPETLNNPRLHKAHVKGEYTELEECRATVSMAKVTHQLRPGPVNCGRDVESGVYGFPVRDTFCIQTRPDGSF